MTSLEEKTIIGNRYEILSKVGEGGIGVVYRAADLLTEEVVAIKYIKPADERPDSESLTPSSSSLSMAEEFRLLATLRHPHIVSVLDYGFDGKKQPYFVMELLEEARPFTHGADSISMEEKLERIAQMFNALSYLHRRGIVHRDIKPENVLLEGDRVKVVDFGLARAVKHLDADREGISGTIRYMAPEVFQGGRISPRTDIYAAGLIAYELLEGRYPFNDQDFNSLLMDVLTREVSGFSSDPPGPVQELVLKIIAKNEDDRPPNAEAILRVLNQSLGKKVLFEPSARESFLKAAGFVDREEIFSELLGSLKDLQRGAGSCWLVGGESGVGKSRLLDELSPHALLTGARVLRTHCEDHASTTYQFWRSVLRNLCLHTRLSVEEAAILKPLVPDIGKITRLTVPDLPDVQASVAKGRLQTVIQQLFLGLEDPLVIIVEDLQWAREESMEILQLVLKSIADLPVMIACNYRSEERPNLPQELPEARSFQLLRLETQYIRELSENILGESGKHQEVVDLIASESEGNTFFIVEIARGLMTDDGDPAALPAREGLISGGIRALIQRRVQQVSEGAYPLLEVAAVIGRELDLAVARKVLQVEKLDDCLLELAEANVLMVQDNRWQFAHAKIRDIVLELLEADRSASLHASVASAIETIYTDDLSEFLESLVNHWTQTGNIEKEIEYLEKAGRHALQTYADRTAVRHFTRVIETGKANYGAEGMADPVVRLRFARWEHDLGEAYQRIRGLSESAAAYERSLGYLDRPIPEALPPLVPRVLAELLTQISARSFPRKKIRQPDAPLEIEKLTLRFQNYERLAEIYYFLNRAGHSIYASLALANTAEKIGPSSELAIAYAYLSAISALIPLHRAARGYTDLSLGTLEMLEDPHTMARVYMSISANAIGAGDLQTPLGWLTQAEEIFREEGNWDWWGTTIELLSRAYSFSGQFEEMSRWTGRLYERAKAQDALLRQSMGLTSMLEALAFSGHSRQVLEARTEAERIVDQSEVPGDRVKFYSASALAHLQEGDWEASSVYTRQTIDRLDNQRPVSFGILNAYALPVFTSLMLWQAPEFPDAKGFETEVLRSLKLLKSFAKVFPIGRPAALCFDGVYAWQTGSPAKARSMWAESLALSKRFGMRFFEALTHMEIGRHTLAADADTSEHLKKALALFSTLKTPYFHRLAAERLEAIETDQG